MSIDWFWLILGMQGSVVGVQGAEQTWFITSLLICYLVTPIISVAVNKLKKNIQTMFLKPVLFICPAVLMLVPQTFVSTVYAPVAWYTLAYLLGTEFYSIQLTKKKTVTYCAAIGVLFCIRILVRCSFDGTFLYDRFIVGYTHYLAAFCIFYIFAYVFERRQPLNFITFFSGISFEMYLYHYMFTVGPIVLFGLTPCWLTDCILVTTVTMIIAFAMNQFTQVILKKLNY